MAIRGAFDDPDTSQQSNGDIVEEVRGRLTDTLLAVRMLVESANR